MHTKYRPVIRCFSALSINFAAVWFTLIFITPNFSQLDALETIIVLTRDILSGSVCLIAAIHLENTLEAYR